MKAGEIVEQGGKKYLVLGKTFGTKTKLSAGDRFVLEGETLNLEHDDEGKAIKASVWVPEVIEATDKGADSLEAIVERAKGHGVLQEKVRHEGGEVEYLPTDAGKPSTATKGRWVTIAGHPVFIEKSRGVPSGKIADSYMTWQSEDTITGSMVIEHSEDKAPTEEQIKLFITDNLANEIESLRGPKDVESIKILERNEGPDWVSVEIDVTPTEAAGNRWLEEEGGTEEWLTYHGQSSLGEKAEAEAYPDESKKLRFVAQNHYRGKSVSDLTPLIVRENGGVPHVRFISELWKGGSSGELEIKGWEVWSSQGWERIKRIYKHAKHEKLVRVNCFEGAVDVTEDHSLFRGGRAIKTDSLIVGDTVDLASGFPSLPEGKGVHPDYAWLLGLWLAEGYFHRGYTATICNNSTELLERAGEVAERHGFSTSIYESGEKAYKLEISGWRIFEQFIVQGPHVGKTRNARVKRIPPFVFGWDSTSKAALLEGFFEGDGDHLRDRENLVGFSTSSQALAQGLLLLLSQTNPSQHFSISLQENLFRIRFVDLAHNRAEQDRGKIRGLLPSKNGDHRGKKNPNYKDGLMVNSEPFPKQFFVYSPKRAVYDIETESHSFMAGVGKILAHNSCHLDMRFEYKRGDSDYLRGWTVAHQVAGAIKAPVTTMAQAKKLNANSANWKMDLKTGLVKPRQIRGGTVRRGDLRAFQKAAEIPKNWLDTEGVTEKQDPGERPPAGATRQYPGVFTILDKGEVEWGAQKPWFHEWFLEGGKWHGRWCFRLVKREGEKFYAPETVEEYEAIKAEVLPPGKEEEEARTGSFWLLMQPEKQTPYVLSKEAIEEDWLPPKGVSCLPAKMRKSVPKELRYWEMDRKEALEARDKLAEFEELGGTELKLLVLRELTKDEKAEASGAGRWRTLPDGRRILVTAAAAGRFGGGGRVPSAEGDANNRVLNDFLSSDVDWRYASYEERSATKAAIVAELAEKTGIDEEEVNKLIRQWADSSNNSDMRSLSLQEDAAAEFALPVSEFTQSRIDEVRKDWNKLGKTNQEYWEEDAEYGRSEYHRLMDSSQQREFMRAMYQHTQQRLREQGLKGNDVITLYRGVRLPTDVAKGWEKGDHIGIVGNTLESWSSGERVAHRFADSIEYGERAVIFKMDVPVKMIMGTARTGFGCLSEGEVIVLGSKGGTAEVLYIKD